MVLANESLNAAFGRVQASVNRQLERQYAQLSRSLQGFLDDLFNFPLERPWRATLAQFAAHWEARGLRLTESTLVAIGHLIEDRISQDAQEAFAEGPLSYNELFSVHSDAASPYATRDEAGDDDEASRDDSFDGRISAAAIFEAQRIQKRFGLTEEERMRLEFFFNDKFRRIRDGRPLLPEPLFLYEAKQRQLQGPSMRAISPEQMAESVRRERLDRYWELPPEERRKIDRELEREARNKLAAEYGGTVAFLNPGLPGGFSDLATALGGFAGAGVPNRGQSRPLASAARNRRGPRGKQPPPPVKRQTPKKGNPGRAGASGSTVRKPRFPPPIDQQRYPIRPDGSAAANLKIAAESEEAMAYYLHSIPDYVVIFWGQKQGMQGADIITFNLRTKQITLWDVKYRSAAVRLRPSQTFNQGTKPYVKSTKQAIDAVLSSRLSDADKEIALQAISLNNVRTVTVGYGNAKNSSLGK